MRKRRYLPRRSRFLILWRPVGIKILRSRNVLRCHSRLSRQVCKQAKRNPLKFFLLTIAVLCSVLYVIQPASPLYGTNRAARDATSTRWFGMQLLNRFFFGRTLDDHNAEQGPLRPESVFAPDCTALGSGDPEEIKFTKRLLFREVRHQTEDVEYLEMSKNCTKFKKEFNFLPASLLSQEEKASIAFVISADKNVEQTLRLIRAIYSPSNAYCICLRQGASKIFTRAMRSIMYCFDNIVYTNAHRWNQTHPAAVNDIKCDRRCLRYMLDRIEPWRYLIKLHAQDFPLVTNSDIAAKLKSLGRHDISVLTDHSHLEKKHGVIVEINPKQNISIPAPQNSSNTDPSGSVVTNKQQHIMLWRGSPFFIASRRFLHQFAQNSLTYNILTHLSVYSYPESYYWNTLFLHYLNDSHQASAMAVASQAHFRLMSIKNLPSSGHCSSTMEVNPVCLYEVEDLQSLLQTHHPENHGLFAHAFDLDFDHIVYGCLEGYYARYTKHQSKSRNAEVIIKEEIIPQNEVQPQEQQQRVQVPHLQRMLEAQQGKGERGHHARDRGPEANHEHKEIIQGLESKHNASRDNKTATEKHAATKDLKYSENKGDAALDPKAQSDAKKKELKAQDIVEKKQLEHKELAHMAKKVVQDMDKGNNPFQHKDHAKTAQQQNRTQVETKTGQQTGHEDKILTKDHQKGTNQLQDAKEVKHVEVQKDVKVGEKHEKKITDTDDKDKPEEKKKVQLHDGKGTGNVEGDTAITDNMADKS